MSRNSSAKITKQKRQGGGKPPTNAPSANTVEDEQDLLDGMELPKFGYVLAMFSFQWLTLLPSQGDLN